MSTQSPHLANEETSSSCKELQKTDNLTKPNPSKTNYRTISRLTKILQITTLALPFFSLNTLATDLYWCISGNNPEHCTADASVWSQLRYSTPQELSEAWLADYTATYKDWNVIAYPESIANKSGFIRIIMTDKITGIQTYNYAWAIDRRGDGCAAGTTNNPSTGICEPPETALTRKFLGEPDKTQSCNAPASLIGNPIDVSTGNKLEILEELKTPSLSFKIFYNSTIGQWTHSYSSHLDISPETIALTFDDGRQSLFSLNGNSATAETTELGILTKNSDGWLYQRPNDSGMQFDETGKLINIIPLSGPTLSLKHNDTSTIISGGGAPLTITESAIGQPFSLSYASTSISYTYDTLLRLTRTDSIASGTQTSRIFHYESTTNPRLLTGVTDALGARYATWEYDSDNRAIVTEHANGAQKYSITYNNDNSTTVTNSLGKKTIYHFQVIQGVNRLTAIEGEPSANCSASNSSYTYNDRGQILTKTDAQGYVTTYTYNDRGLESSRTEAFGTPFARTTTTEWDPVRFLPTKITTPTQTTLYIYDDQGRQLSQQTTMTSAN